MSTSIAAAMFGGEGRNRDGDNDDMTLLRARGHRLWILRRLETKTMDSIQGYYPRRCPHRVPRWTQRGSSTRVEHLLGPDD